MYYASMPLMNTCVIWLWDLFGYLTFPEVTINMCLTYKTPEFT